MRATLTELHRTTRKVVQPAIQQREKITLTEFGQPCAEILPFVARKVVSEDELRGSVISDEAILAAVSEARE
jgi:antitoxin (DNA-binding transcriptional repressor) of toxin-antitoxin stability system